METPRRENLLKGAPVDEARIALAGPLVNLALLLATLLEENEEGTLDWHPVASISDLPMWEGDRHFLPMVFDNDPRAFHGYMPYDGGKPLSWEFTRI